jgi:integrase
VSTQGSIRKDDSGAWFFVIDINGLHGKRRQVKRRGFATKKAAQAALTALNGDVQRETFVAPLRSTLGQFLIDDWLPARSVSLRPSTVVCYEQVIRNYIVPTVGSVRQQAVDGAMLNRLYGELLATGRTGNRRNAGPGLSVKTVRNPQGVLTRAFRDGVRWGHLQRNPCDAADPPKGASPEMKVWSSDQLRTFSQSVAAHRWSAVWSLMSTTGMRRGEVLGLRWSDVDLEARTVQVQSTRIRYRSTIATSTPKTARGNRTIAVGPAIVTALRAWKRSRRRSDCSSVKHGRTRTDWSSPTSTDQHQTPRPSPTFSPTSLVEPGYRVIGLHDLRHSYATAAQFADGVPVKVVSQRIGHADVGVTLKVYAHVLPGDDESAARSAEIAAFGSPSS